MDILAKKRILVTGGAGFIGSHTVDALVDAGADVTVIDIKPQTEAVNLSHQFDAIEYVEGTICDAVLMDTLCSEAEYVIHLAALVSVPLSIEDPIRTHETNVTGTLTVLHAAKKAGVQRVVYASSAAVYGDTDALPIKESTTLNPQSPYALHKVMNEQYGKYFARDHGLETVGLRYFNVFGSRQDPSSPYSGVISIFVKQAQEGNEITVYGDGEQTRDFVHVRDVVQANLLALTTPIEKCAICNIGTGTETSINTLLTELESATGSALTLQNAQKRTGDIERSCANIGSAHEQFSYEPEIVFAEGLRDLL